MSYPTDPEVARCGTLAFGPRRQTFTLSMFNAYSSSVNSTLNLKVSFLASSNLSCHHSCKIAKAHAFLTYSTAYNVLYTVLQIFNGVEQCGIINQSNCCPLSILTHSGQSVLLGWAHSKRMQLQRVLSTRTTCIRCMDVSYCREQLAIIVVNLYFMLGSNQTLREKDLSCDEKHLWFVMRNIYNL